MKEKKGNFKELNTRLELNKKTDWVPVYQYEGLYLVSTNGQFIYGLKEKVLKTFRNRRGYRIVTLCKEGKRKTIDVHRIVYTSVNGPMPKGLEVHHINHNSQDNRIENLKAISKLENIRLAHEYYKKGQRKKLKPQFNQDGITAVIKVNNDGRYTQFFPSIKDAVNAYGGIYPTLKLHISGKSKSFCGHKWIGFQIGCAFSPGFNPSLAIYRFNNWPGKTEGFTIYGKIKFK